MRQPQSQQPQAQQTQQRQQPQRQQMQQPQSQQPQRQRAGQQPIQHRLQGQQSQAPGQQQPLGQQQGFQGTRGGGDQGTQDQRHSQQFRQRMHDLAEQRSRDPETGRFLSRQQQGGDQQQRRESQQQNQQQPQQQSQQQPQQQGGQQLLQRSERQGPEPAQRSPVLSGRSNARAVPRLPTGRRDEAAARCRSLPRLVHWGERRSTERDDSSDPAKPVLRRMSVDGCHRIYASSPYPYSEDRQ